MYRLAEVFVICTLLILVSSCDLSLQKGYDFDYDAHPDEPEPINMSIYDYMAEKSEFDLFVEAIDRADMQNVYESGEDGKTVLMLKNEAINEFVSARGYSSVDDIPMETLNNLLEYHIITEAVMQKDLNIREYTVLQTQIDGSDGLIKLWKHEDYWQIHVNPSGGPEFPESAKGAQVYHHNFDFDNGVGHSMTEYVRRVPH